MEKQEEIIIANPMFDVVFKGMIEDKENARYLVETFISEEIMDIELAQQEYIYYRQTETENKTKEIKVIRLDFVATVRTKDGEYKKILIEIQQSLNPIDSFRFRSYLAKQYAAHENIIRREKIIVKNDKVTIKEEIVNLRSIIAIYILGFEIEDAPNIIFKQIPQCFDVFDGSEVNTQHPIVKDLSHESYYVQIPRVKPEMYNDWSKCSRLMKLLSLFEQNYFVDKNYLKKYKYPIDSITDKPLEKMINTLRQIAADPHTRRVMEEEAFAAMNIDFLKQSIVNKDVIIDALQSSNDALQSSNDALKNQLEEYRRKFGKLNGLPA